MTIAPGQRAYRAHVLFDHRGATVFSHFGTVSPCGEWVEAGDTRWRLDDSWFASDADAKASKAGEVMEMAATMKRQAEALKPVAAV
jgi:hypothetical protein